MQSTIFGASCAERARHKEDANNHGDTLKTTWDDDDFADPGLEDASVGRTQERKTRIFRAWLESWETEVQAKQDPVNEAKLLQKYGGLLWVDPDHGHTFMASREQMHWSQMRGSRGYCVKGLLESYDNTDPENDD